MAAVGGVYTAMWNAYLNNELKFTSTSTFIDLNNQAFQFWDFTHIDPAGAQKGTDARATRRFIPPATSPPPWRPTPT